MFLMQLTIFHILILLILGLCFILMCLLIFIKIKERKSALIFYTIASIFTLLLGYCLFLTIKQYTTEARLSKLSFLRKLRQESIIVSGRVENLKNFQIQKCYLMLNIVNKKEPKGAIFDARNIRKARMENTGVSYVIELINILPPRSYKDFKAKVPLPPSFDNPEFYHSLKCI